ncbi:hypothetical protein VTN77DRAFT_6819 [Rasamsonia byssochlamydoides]|uniref:uncharacterized protein n=1 Tax=Rasamsonia byssochlamydoides TaxID=89139 RepID=UPI00374283A9
MDNPGVPRDPAQLQRHGQELYRRGEYQQAIHVFTQALESNSTDALGVLDNRSATWCKLGNFERALRDAKEMIQKDRLDERGYLRAAKALLLNKRPFKALDIYAYGLKTLPKDHPRYALLRQLHNKLQDKMCEKFRDPFDVLPLEIAVMVLRYLNFKQIVAILRVSKKWAQFLTSVRELWLRLDLSKAHSTVPMPAIRSYINRSKGMLTHAIINHVSPTNMGKVLELLSRCPNLTHLEVAGRCDGDKLYNLFKTSKKLKVLITSSEIPVTRACMKKFLKDLPDLERLKIDRSLHLSSDGIAWSEKLPNLKALALTTDPDEVPAGIQELLLPCYGDLDENNTNAWVEREKKSLECAPNLEELSLRSMAGKVHGRYFVSLSSLCFPKLRKLSLSSLELYGRLVFPPSLEHLHIHLCERYNTRDDPVPHLPNLTTLVLDDFPWMTSSRLARLLNATESTLKVLEVRNCFKISGSDIARLASETRALKGVQTLSLLGMYRLDDAIVSQLLEGMPELRTLNIPHTAVTGVTIKTIIDMRVAETERRSEKDVQGASSPQSSSGDPNAEKDRKPLVQVLNLQGCENVSLDAIDFGRKQGLTIIR